jgi:hypothetical protein
MSALSRDSLLEDFAASDYARKDVAATIIQIIFSAIPEGGEYARPVWYARPSRPIPEGLSLHDVKGDPLLELVKLGLQSGAVQGVV